MTLEPWNNGPTTTYSDLSLSLHLMLIIKHVLRKMGAKNGQKPRGGGTWIIVSYNVI